MTTKKGAGEADDPRRRWLIQALAAGAFSTTAGGAALAQILGTPPSRLPPGRSVYRTSGRVLINGQPATLESRIAHQSKIETGKDGELVYVVGESAYIARGDTQVIVETGSAESAIVTGLKIITGKLLSVFPSRRPVQITTKVASIGIRGTGVYLESDPEQTYFCTCYGIADVSATHDPQSRETVAAQHHDKPLYILANEQPGRNIRNAPFVNHTDQELMLIETLVGRQPPFVFPKGDYTGPRRGY
jgi:hypothetical protein